MNVLLPSSLFEPPSLPFKPRSTPPLLLTLLPFNPLSPFNLPPPFNPPSTLKRSWPHLAEPHLAKTAFGQKNPNLAR